MSETSAPDHVGVAPLPGQGRSVLISGGSIAGPSLAWWLNKYGFQTTIVERWHELRGGGQNIDVRGVGVSGSALPHVLSYLPAIILFGSY
jgi:flavin-dependent dehydrogenase